MTQPKYRYRPMRIIFAVLLVCVMLLSCGLTALAAEEGSPDVPQTAPPPETSTPIPPDPVEFPAKDLYPADVQTLMLNGARQIVKTYLLSATQSPADIPCEDFERDEWLFTMTDITERRTDSTETRSHVETVEILTESNDPNEIIKQLEPTMDYEDEDGYCGLLTLDLASVSCEAAGYKNSSYAVTANREYPHLSANDLSLIPMSITENGRTLELDSVTWEVQHSVNVDYEEIPDSYRAIVKYTTTAYTSKVTGYITTAEYYGEVVRQVAGDTVYTVYFSGSAIRPLEPPQEIIESPAPVEDKTLLSYIPIILIVAVITALASVMCAYFFLRHNAKVYCIDEDGKRSLAAKLRVSPKSSVIDLTPLGTDTNEQHFLIEIDNIAAKKLNNTVVDVVFGASRLSHKIAHEGGVYKIEVNFTASTIKANH